MNQAPCKGIRCLRMVGNYPVSYEPVSKTVIIKNMDYYGWVKSIALAAVADFFEEVPFRALRYSVHGSVIDVGVMVSPS